MTRFLETAARRTFIGLERLNMRSSLVPRQPFYDRADFPWVEPLERRWLAIRTELDRVLTLYRLTDFQNVVPGQHALMQDDDWRSFLLLAPGRSLATNAQLCPETAALVGSIPGATTAFFSILKPGKRIPPHRGPYNGVLRLHLGLKVPADRTHCRLRVGSEWTSWQEGRCLIFDDTFEHEVANDTPDHRAILFVDFVRPMRFPMSRFNETLMRSVARMPAIQRRFDVEMWPAEPPRH